MAFPSQKVGPWLCATAQGWPGWMVSKVALGIWKIQRSKILVTIFLTVSFFCVFYLCKESYVETELCLMTLSNHHFPIWKRYHLFYTYDFFWMKFLVLPSLKGIPRLLRMQLLWRFKDSTPTYKLGQGTPYGICALMNGLYVLHCIGFDCGQKLMNHFVETWKHNIFDGVAWIFGARTLHRVALHGLLRMLKHEVALNQSDAFVVPLGCKDDVLSLLQINWHTQTFTLLYEYPNQDYLECCGPTACMFCSG